MALNYSFPGPSGLANSTAIRKDLAGLVVRDTAGVVRGGVFPRHTNSLITARSDMRVNVLAFEGVTVRGGALFIANDGTTASPLLATAPASNARIDVIYFKQNEAASPYADVDDSPVFGVVTGVASGDPQVPALTIAGAEPLGTVYIPSTATATNSAGVVITPTHRFTAAAGGILLVRSSATYPALPYYGQQVDDMALGYILRWNGTEWEGAAGELILGSVAPVSGWTVGGASVVKSPNGLVTANVSAAKGSTINDGDGSVTIATGFRPAITIAGAGGQSSGGAAGSCYVTIGTNGVVRSYGVNSANRQITFSFTYPAA